MNEIKNSTLVFQLSFEPIGKENYLSPRHPIVPDYLFRHCRQLNPEERKEAIDALLALLPKDSFKKVGENSLRSNVRRFQLNQLWYKRFSQVVEGINVRNISHGYGPAVEALKLLENPLGTRFLFNTGLDPLYWEAKPSRSLLCMLNCMRKGDTVNIGAILKC